MVRIIHLLSSQTGHALGANDGGLSLSMFFRFFVPDEKFAFLAVALRLLLCDLDDGEDAVAFAEDRVHLLERAICRFGIEEPDTGENEGVAAVVVT